MKSLKVVIISSLLLVSGFALSADMNGGKSEADDNRARNVAPEEEEEEVQGESSSGEEEDCELALIELSKDYSKLAASTYKYLPERSAIAQSNENIKDAEILWARILCDENCPIVTKDIKKKLWLLNAGFKTRLFVNNGGVIIYTSCLAVAISTGIAQYFGFIGGEKDCSTIEPTQIDGTEVVSYDEFQSYVGCLSDNSSHWYLPNSVANLTAGLALMGGASIAYNQLLTFRETKKNDIQDGLAALRAMYQGIAEALLQDWVSKVNAIREDIEAGHIVLPTRGGGSSSSDSQTYSNDALTPAMLDTLYAKTRNAILPTDITFAHINELLTQYPAIERRMKKFLRRNNQAAVEILLPLKEVAELLKLDSDFYDGNLMLLALDKDGQLFGGGSFNWQNAKRSQIKRAGLTNESLKGILAKLE